MEEKLYLERSIIQSTALTRKGIGMSLNNKRLVNAKEGSSARRKIGSAGNGRRRGRDNVRSGRKRVGTVLPEMKLSYW